MLEKWKSAAGNRNSFEELLTDLSKAFGCLSHTGITCKKIRCYMPESACRLLLLQMLKYFEVMLNIFEFSHVKEILES